mgnify:CR=1 FL=1
MNIIITGGNGLLAGRIGKYLSDNNHNITFTTRHNLNNTLKYKNTRYIEVDYEDNNYLAKHLNNIDIIILRIKNFFFKIAFPYLVYIANYNSTNLL